MLNYATVTEFTRRDGRIAGLIARDVETGEELTIQARAVINATGVFVDAVRRLDDAGAAPLLTLSQGAHLVLDRSFMPGSTALLVPRTDDGRVLFAIPWHDRVLVGTTDTPTTELAIEPRPLHEEVAYLTDYVGRYLDRRPTADRHPEHLRRPEAPAPRPHRLADVQAFARARGRRLRIRTDHGHGREMDDLSADGDRRRRPGRTRGKPSHACHPRPPTSSCTAGKRIVSHGDDPLSVYGSDIPQLKELGVEHPEWNQPLHPSLPYRASEVVWAARHEAARSVAGRARTPDACPLPRCPSQHRGGSRRGQLLAAELGRDKKWEEQQVADFARSRRATYPLPELNASGSGPDRPLVRHENFTPGLKNVCHLPSPLALIPSSWSDIDSCQRVCK